MIPSPEPVYRVVSLALIREETLLGWPLLVQNTWKPVGTIPPVAPREQQENTRLRTNNSFGPILIKYRYSHDLNR